MASAFNFWNYRVGLQCQKANYRKSRPVSTGFLKQGKGCSLLLSNGIIELLGGWLCLWWCYLNLPENPVFCWGLEVLSKTFCQFSPVSLLHFICILSSVTQGFGFVVFNFYILLMIWYGWLGSYPKCPWYNGCSTRGRSSPPCDWHNGSLCSGWRMRLRTSYYGERSWESSLQLLVWAWFKGAYLLCLEALFLCSGNSYHPSVQPSQKRK